MARPGLRNHRKFRRLQAVLKLPAVYVEAHLEAMWKVGYENGDPRLGDAQDVELSAEWAESGRPSGEWFKAALEAGWIDETEPGRYEIHDLLDHAPDYVRSRADREAERKKPKICGQCGGVYRSTEKHSKFCCDNCRVAFHRSKNGRDVTHGNEDLRNGNEPVTQCNEPPAPAPAPAPAPSLRNTLPADSAAGTAEKVPRPRAKATGDHATFIEHFVTRWQDQNGAKYRMLAKDGVAAAKILKLAGSLAQACEIADRYLETHDRYLDEQRHPLPLLLNQINRFLANGTAGGRTANANNGDPDSFVAVHPDPSELPWNRARAGGA